MWYLQIPCTGGSRELILFIYFCFVLFYFILFFFLSSSMILYNHTTFFKSGERNSCRLSSLPTATLILSLKYPIVLMILCVFYCFLMYFYVTGGAKLTGFFCLYCIFCTVSVVCSFIFLLFFFYDENNKLELELISCRCLCNYEHWPTAII